MRLMRLMRRAAPALTSVVLTSLALLAGCIDHPSTPALPADEDAGLLPPPNTTGTTPDPEPEPQPPPDPVAFLQEEVYVLMKDWNDKSWMCTGTLVKENVVVTAAHCIDDSEFASFEIIAPNAPDQPRVAASGPNRMSYDYTDNPGDPDIGILWLDEPIALPQYAVFTDVTAALESGQAVKGTAVVRTAEEPEAPFKSVENLTVTSTTDRGYTHGIATPYFSHGGDSGAGLFLVENGAVTHQLIGVARQPEEGDDLDHFTRIDAAFLAWFEENTGE